MHYQFVVEVLNIDWLNLGSMFFPEILKFFHKIINRRDKNIM